MIGLINNLPINSGMGRYAFTVFNGLKEKVDIEHLFLNYSERTIEKYGKNNKKPYKITKQNDCTVARL